MPLPTDQGRQKEDDWTSLHTPEAAAVAIAKLEALGRSVAGVAARRRCLDLLDLQPGQAVLDVGAGTGLAAIEIAQRVGSTGRIVGLDSSKPLGAFACEAASRADVGGALEWHTGHAEALPFPDASFDRCFCHWVLLHVEDAHAVISEMRRVTRPGGRILCVEVDWETVTVHPGDRALTRSILNFSNDRHIEGWSGRRLAPLLRECSLEHISVEPIVITDEAAHGSEWLGFLKQRADMAAAGGAVSRDQATTWINTIEQAAHEGRYFFSVTQFVVRGVIADAPMPRGAHRQRSLRAIRG